VGSLTPKKDHPNLLAAIGLLAPEHPSLRLVVVGTGPMEAQLRRDVERSGLGSRVHLLGARDDVPHILPAFDVFVVSSRYEGLPLALVEAMAAGLPSVATSVGGIPELLDDGRTGFLVAPGDPAALAAAVEKLLCDPKTRAEMGWWAAVDAVRWNVAAAVEKMQELYEQALSVRPSRG
jgi:glycosyltransferase involved in cell wall biosynthesis